VPFVPFVSPYPDAVRQAASLVPDRRVSLGIAPGPSTSDKYWPTKHHVELARRATAEGWGLVYLLGPMETAHRDWIRAAAPDALIVDIERAGGDETYLPWLIHAVSARLSASLAMEGGLGHLIATTGGRLMTLAGPTDPFCWKPMTDQWWLVRAQEFGARQMSAIPVDAVLDRAREMLASASLAPAQVGSPVAKSATA
jgi:ADP-heptose:LPS heptosyltransferase